MPWEAACTYYLLYRPEQPTRARLSGVPPDEDFRVACSCGRKFCLECGAANGSESEESESESSSEEEDDDDDDSD